MIEKLGLTSLEDCLFHLPLRYENATSLTTASEAMAQMSEDAIQIEATIRSSEIVLRPRRQWLVWLLDDDGVEVVLRYLHFYSSQVNKVSEGQRVRVRGVLKATRFLPGASAEMIHPSIVSADKPLSQHLTPIYPSTAGVTQARIQKVIAHAVAQLPIADTLSESIRTQYRLMDLSAALKILHHPPPDGVLEAFENRTHPAWQRLKFDELLAQQMSLRQAHMRRQTLHAPQFEGTGIYTQTFRAQLPFALTAAQQRVGLEITQDMQHTYPMQRLLQGDVGSGKTIVAALAATEAIDSGYQVALMAPTEILAEQHFHKLTQWLSPLGITLAWLSGSQKKSDKARQLELIASGQAQMVIGTHALIQETVSFARLGLAIIDEQHRFGVAQRLALRSVVKNTDDDSIDSTEAEWVPHHLMMTATPIPRTLAMSYFADLDISVLDELPPGRTAVKTRVVDQSRRSEVIARMDAEIAEGRQAYWVCPLIEESETLQLTTATESYQNLCEALPNRRICLLHGRLKATEKHDIMAAFSARELDVLVSTTVIEVGVDVPNASVMVIENSERFGLSQLHQLRGRVGRGAQQSVCLLMFQTPLSRLAKERLRVMHSSNDGFEIARFDLQQRGPGELLGARQAGDALLRFADIDADQYLISQAQELAIEALVKNPDLVRAHLLRWMRGRLDYLRA